jgi:Flp pilus assembly pilin Flp
MTKLNGRRVFSEALGRLRLSALRLEECGQDLTENALAAALIALGMIVTTHSVAVGLSTELTNVSQVVITGHLPDNQINGNGK